ncbi:MAG: helix-turn-helix transcriptional regulator [Thermoplasmatales archaeon]|nr:helix-turn-helix transcriptional regulator [Thermoplasmatales archaeon]MCW6169767.1 helix-turn-helix transcriptional regulator [Thermoplasmatales archaeon]
MASYKPDTKDMNIKGSTTICPIVEAIKEIGSEWKLIVIRYLDDGPSGFNDLLRTANGINSKTLSSTLKSLEESGIIVRNVQSTRPFRVRYELTSKGKALNKALMDLKEWGQEWVVSIPDNQVAT